MARSNVMIDNDKTRVTEWFFEVGDEQDNIFMNMTT